MNQIEPSAAVVTLSTPVPVFEPEQVNGSVRTGLTWYSW